MRGGVRGGEARCGAVRRGEEAGRGSAGAVRGRGAGAVRGRGGAHFCVSRFSFCSSAPPLPKATFPAAQPLSCIACRITLSDSYDTPSPWMTRM